MGRDSPPLLAAASKQNSLFGAIVKIVVNHWCVDDVEDYTHQFETCDRGTESTYEASLMSIIDCALSTPISERSADELIVQLNSKPTLSPHHGKEYQNDALAMCH